MNVAQVFALNKAAPVATPLTGSVSASVSPTFQWTRNGDPSGAHRNDQFFLVFSRDDFASHRVIVPVPTRDVTSYQPTDAEWQSVQAGAVGPCGRRCGGGHVAAAEEAIAHAAPASGRRR